MNLSLRLEITYFGILMGTTFEGCFALEFDFVQSVDHVAYLTVDKLIIRKIQSCNQFACQQIPSISEALKGAATNSNVNENLFASL